MTHLRIQSSVAVRACLYDLRLRNEVRICHGFFRIARLAHVDEVVEFSPMA
jgi:hypothetical protein